jgi:hypothetical protein
VELVELESPSHTFPKYNEHITRIWTYPKIVAKAKIVNEINFLEQRQ